MGFEPLRLGGATGGTRSHGLPQHPDRRDGIAAIDIFGPCRVLMSPAPIRRSSRVFWTTCRTRVLSHRRAISGRDSHYAAPSAIAHGERMNNLSSRLCLRAERRTRLQRCSLYAPASVHADEAAPIRRTADRFVPPLLLGPSRQYPRHHRSRIGPRSRLNSAAGAVKYGWHRSTSFRLPNPLNRSRCRSSAFAVPSASPAKAIALRSGRCVYRGPPSVDSNDVTSLRVHERLNRQHRIEISTHLEIWVVL
ncbi:hypothetical protein ABIB73_007420 [Bradyrhizobium sp. F1.4.3]